jgi:hypothetical protein
MLTFSFLFEIIRTRDSRRATDAVDSGLPINTVLPFVPDRALVARWS